MILMIFKFEAFLILRSGTLFSYRDKLNKVLIFWKKGDKLNVLDKFSYFLVSDREYIGKDAFS